jgi:phosphate transport system protein
MVMPREILDKMLGDLQHELIRMGSMAEEAIHLAVDSLAEQDLNVAKRIVAGDDIIDTLALTIEEECIRLIALQQPIARDLRVITTVLKTITDLERIADHAVNIAEITLRIGADKLIKPLVDIPRMARMAEEMLRDSLKAFVDRDIKLARENCLKDEDVDKLYEVLLIELTDFCIRSEDEQRSHQALNLLFVARYLERVADHATNIGERVIYLVTGKNERY